MPLEHLRHLPPDRYDGVERRHRILEDHRDVATADRPQLAVVHRQQLPAVERHRARNPTPRLGSSPMIASEVTLLPRPDSPTRPTVSPPSTLKLTPSTAATSRRPRRVNTTFRSRTSSNLTGRLAFSLSPLAARLRSRRPCCAMLTAGTCGSRASRSRSPSRVKPRARDDDCNAREERQHAVRTPENVLSCRPACGPTPARPGSAAAKAEERQAGRVDDRCREQSTSLRRSPATWSSAGRGLARCADVECRGTSPPARSRCPAGPSICPRNSRAKIGTSITAIAIMTDSRLFPSRAAMPIAKTSSPGMASMMSTKPHDHARRPAAEGSGKQSQE